MPPGADTGFVLRDIELPPMERQGRTFRQDISSNAADYARLPTSPTGSVRLTRCYTLSSARRRLCGGGAECTRKAGQPKTPVVAMLLWLRGQDLNL